MDLTGARWFEPGGSVGIAAFAEAQIDSWRNVHVCGTKSPSLARYPTRMRVDKALDSIGVIHDLPPVNEIESEDLRELRRFEGESGAHEPARLLFDKITTRPLAYWRPP